jgi:hypothetical protein
MQRYLKRGDVTFPPPFDDRQYFQRDETFELWVYQRFESAPVPDNRKEPVEVPDFVLSIVEQLDAGDDGLEMEGLEEREVQRERFDSIYEAFEGTEIRWPHDFYCAQERNHCISRPGNCESGGMSEDYWFRARGNKRALDLRYEWEGLSSSLDLGERLTL